ncbi:LysR family transcriptional regulator [Agrobacterium vitis]|uniref:LysR family transcriptional regulator n=1 Tax=Agrobacterium vitis TaxID=373 RepID=UPI0012E7F400|nr:LysR family transcriptional regulator [Agrobacterium vitis]MCF1452932.1 LysR family transcriptional regulator [Agrobacterium vitis]MVA77846.1 LysR family transcriptional regulator [Agrobacterium vitis]BCH55674.1 LysR family transcriptional regulator [Agrobacterium vitis]
MITLRQLEALYWISHLGTFERAATRLNTTQSAISKRIQELELVVGLAVFDRNQRGARLTEKGEHLLAMAEEMLRLQEQILELKTSGETPARRLRLGVTELSAMTWFPRLISKIRELYPKVSLEPHVDTSRALDAMLRDDELDLIVIPEVFPSDEVICVRLADVSNAWMARPGLVAPTDEALTLEQLSKYPAVIQGGRSGTGLFYNRWLRSQGLVFPQAIASDNLMALVGFTIAGVGISYLPRQCLRPLVDEGRLVVIPTRPVLPPIPYSAVYRNDRPSAFTAIIADLMCDICDFSRQLQS